MNKIISFGFDGIWRDKAVKYAYGLTLDVACGTGELSSRLSCSDNVEKVIGVDISEKMIKWGVRNKRFCKNVFFIVSDVENIPFKDGTFDTVSTSFSLRNFENRLKALESMIRALKRGGKLIILDTLRPKMNPILYFFYRFYLMNIIPSIAGVLTADKYSYEYMSKSILTFYTKDQILKILEERGCKVERVEDINFGIVTLIVARRSA